VARGGAEWRKHPPPQIFAPLAYAKLGRIELAKGRGTAAREHYRQLLRRKQVVSVTQQGGECAVTVSG
jgi:hypothetical protein